jgi:hypothetical protein
MFVGKFCPPGSRSGLPPIESGSDPDSDLGPTDLNTIYENIFRWGPDDIKKEDMDHIIKEQIQLRYGEFNGDLIEGGGGGRHTG